MPATYYWEAVGIKFLTEIFWPTGQQLQVLKYRLLRREFQKVCCQQHLCLDTVDSAERNYWKQQVFIFNSSNS